MDIADFIKELKEKSKECKGNGHKEPSNQPYTVSSKSNSLTDQGRGYCGYCYTFYDRHLTNMEREKIFKFQKV
jgi:hypothetical protein